MAKYQKYAEYKDSGVEWLGEIPRHWDSKPLKYLCTYNDEVLPETTAKDAEIQYIDIGSVSAVDGISKIETMIFKDAPSRARRIVRDGDVIVSTVRTYLEAIAPINNPPENLIVSTGFAVIRPNQYLYKSFASYCLRAKGFIKEVVARSVGVSYPAINSSDLVNITIPSIGYVEQVKIANFLDHETAKIDTLIAKQEKLIELLKEKRQAVISHAVTKGLNPDVAMKDSAVEWLGNVPEHWNVIKFNHCVQIRNGLVDPRHENYKNLILYAPNHIDKGTGKILYKETAEEQGADSNKYLCFKGEVIYSKIRPALAKVAICEEDSALCSADMYPMDGFNGLSNKFLYYFILSDSFTEAVILDSDRVAMPKINRESLSEYKLPIPPLEEQKRIIDFIETTGWNLDKLEQQAQKAIQLMQERRIALISSTVTGKIDVRNWQHPNEAKMEFSA